MNLHKEPGHISDLLDKRQVNLFILFITFFTCYKVVRY